MSRIYNPRDILLRPVVSEKSYGLLDEGKYTFIVAPHANKTQIRQAQADPAGLGQARGHQAGDRDPGRG